MKWLALLLLLPLLLLAGGLVLNRPPLLSPPGPLERLKVYLMTNVAETRVDHPFPELRPLLVPADTVEARVAVRDAMEVLGWTEIREANGEITAVVTTPLFRFRDDVSVHLEPRGDATRLYARSASRVGRGDLAANARHLRQLFEAVERQLGLRASGREQL